MALTPKQPPLKGNVMKTTTNTSAQVKEQTAREAVTKLDAKGSQFAPKPTPFELMTQAVAQVSTANGGSANYSSLVKAPIKICEENMATIPQWLQLIASKKNIVLTAKAIINRMEEGTVTFDSTDEVYAIDSTEIYNGNPANKSKDNNRMGWAFNWLSGACAWNTANDTANDAQLAFLKKHGKSDGGKGYFYKVFTS